MNAVAKTEQQRPAQTSSEQQQPGDYVLPPANITANKDEYCLELEMPGVDKEGLEITVENNELTIIGHRKQELPEGELLYSETPLLADYRRAFELGADVDPQKVSAQVNQGVLKLHLPRRENTKRRKIEVSG